MRSSNATIFAQSSPAFQTYFQRCPLKLQNINHKLIEYCLVEQTRLLAIHLETAFVNESCKFRLQVLNTYILLAL